MANSDPQGQQRYRKRVVITGLGAITPIGNTLAEYWEGLVRQKLFAPGDLLLIGELDLGKTRLVDHVHEFRKRPLLRLH